MLVREKCQRLLEKLESEMSQPEELHLPIYTTDTQATQPSTSNEQLQANIFQKQYFLHNVHSLLQSAYLSSF